MACSREKFAFLTITETENVLETVTLPISGLLLDIVLGVFPSSQAEYQGVTCSRPHHLFPNPYLVAVYYNFTILCDATSPLTPRAMPAVALLLAGSPKPDWSRGRRQTKRNTLVLQVGG